MPWPRRAVRAGAPVRVVLIVLALVLAHAAAGTGPPRRNILYLVADDLRPEFLSGYGQHVHTPAIDKLANESLVFLNAYCNFAVCGPSRASFMTGRRRVHERSPTPAPVRCRWPATLLPSRVCMLLTTCSPQPQLRPSRWPCRVASASVGPTPRAAASHVTPANPTPPTALLLIVGTAVLWCACWCFQAQPHAGVRQHAAPQLPRRRVRRQRARVRLDHHVTSYSPAKERRNERRVALWWFLDSVDLSTPMPHGAHVQMSKRC